MTQRWPALVIIASLLVGGVVLSRDDEPAPPRTGPSDPATMMAVGPPRDALDTTWFCPAQTASDDSLADGTVVIANVGRTRASGRLVVASDTGQRRDREVDLAPSTTEQVRVADVLEAGWAAVSVEMERGEVAIEHRVEGRHGRDVTACQTRASDRWYFPSGGTTRDANLYMVVYNPFPDPATVDVSFATDTTVREPEAFRGVPVEPRSFAVLDVAEVVTARAVISGTVTARRGRVVVEQVQSYDGRGGTATEEEAAQEPYRRKGLTLVAGVPAPQLAWDFPAGVKSSYVHEQLTLFNPGRVDAEVTIDVQLDDPRRNGVLDPFPLLVPTGEFRVFDLDEFDAIPAGLTHSVVVRADTGSVVVERTMAAAAGDGAAYRGVATSTGSPIAARRWVFATGPEPEVESGRIALLNPGREPVTVRLVAFGDGRRASVLAEPIRLGAGDRREVNLDELPARRRSVEVLSSGPVVAERRMIATPRPAGSGDDDEPTAEDLPLGSSTTIGLPFGEELVVLG